MRVEVGVLGPVELRLDGVVAPLTGLPQRILLARLALAAGRPVAVADLIDALWGGEPPDNAVGNLHSYVSRLRRHTGREVISRGPGGYRLDLPVGALDVGRVERLVEEARDQQPEQAAETLAEALAVFRGDALGDLGDRLAFAPDIIRLTEWRCYLREECLDRRLRTGAAAAALPEIEALTLAEPLRERAQLLLMRALHQSGRTPEALAATRAFQERMADEHGLDPSPAFVDLHRRILSEDPTLRPREQTAQTRTAAPPVGNTPKRRADRFFGRQSETAQLRSALAEDRVITIVGPGGVGKTRLMTEVLTGTELLVELAELSVPADVATAVAGALGLRAAPRGGVAAIAERLGAAPAVLVLDNCEHLLGAVRELVDGIVGRCPQVRVLATSRHRLGASGERVLRLGPLAEADRVALFCDRAALLRADFPDDPYSRELAAEVCRLVDGLPLAVELAARREAVFGLVHLRDRLGAGLGAVLRVLDPAHGGDRATAVAATVEWSYRLLSPAGQSLLDRLAVCRGGFGVGALLHFGPDGERFLPELVDASLVGCDLSAGAPRYRLLETVRHVGLSHLGPAGERQARDAHARWMLDFATALVRRQRVRNPQTTPALRLELANLQEALSWLGDTDDGAQLAALLTLASLDAPDPGLTAQLVRQAPAAVRSETDALRALAAGLGEALDSRLPEAHGLLTAALDRLPGDHPMRWAALLLRISNAMFAGRRDDVRADALRLLADPAAPGWARANGLCCAALMDAYAGDAAAGRRWLEMYADELATDVQEGFVPFTRSELLAESAPEQALAWYDLALDRSDRIDQAYTGNITRVARAAVLIRLGRREPAIAACREAIAKVRDAGMTAQVWTVLRLTAELLGDLGEAQAAAVIVAAAEASPYAPVVMGADRDRIARLLAGVTELPPPPGSGDSTSVAQYALHTLDQYG